MKSQAVTWFFAAISLILSINPLDQLAEALVVSEPTNLFYIFLSDWIALVFALFGFIAIGLFFAEAIDMKGT